MKIKKYTAIIAMICLFVGGLQTTAAAVTIPSDNKEAIEVYAEEYGWDVNSINTYTWTGKDGEDYQRTTRFQKETFEDAYQYSEAYCLEAGIVFNEAGDNSGNGSGASGIVAVALQEAASEDSAESPLGSNNVKYNTWRYGHQVSGADYSWCANFIAWCADQCGYIESGLFNKSENVKGFYNYQTQTNGFDSHEGTEIEQIGGTGYTAVPGDIFCWGLYTSSFDDDHIGIITSVSETSIEITQGNTCDRVMTISYTAESYNELASGLLVHIEYPAGDGTVFGFLTTVMHLPKAAAAGVCANIFHESNFNPNAVDDDGTSYGLCQWYNERWDSLIEFCDSNGYDWSSLDGQLYFLQFELTNDFPDLLDFLLSCNNDADGAYDAAYQWCIEYEKPADMYKKANIRGNSARNEYYPTLCNT